MKNRLFEGLTRKLNLHRQAGSDVGLLVPKLLAGFGGIFSVSVDGGAFVPNHNTVMFEGLDKMLSDWFNGGAPPAGFYIAPFTNNVNPQASLKASQFAATLGEYKDYTQATRVQWKSNGPADKQTVSNSDNPAEFTIGAAAANITGAALIASAPQKGATTGVLIAAALFAVPNSLNPGSTMKVKYDLTGAPKA